MYNIQHTERYKNCMQSTRVAYLYTRPWLFEQLKINDWHFTLRLRHYPAQIVRREHSQPLFGSNFSSQSLLFVFLYCLLSVEEGTKVSGYACINQLISFNGLFMLIEATT